MKRCMVLIHHTVNVITRIGQCFLHLRNTHFPKIYSISNMFNRNKIKVSYSCMQNIKSIIKNHSVNILHQNKENKDGCNCRIRSIVLQVGNIYRQIQLGVIYLSPNIVNFTEKVYFGVAEKSFNDSTTHQILYS